jgi:chromosome segregation ATPase
MEEQNGIPGDDDLESLRQENAALRSKVEELEQLLATSNQQAEDRWVELQREYETLIEEKSEMIRTLHHRNAELRERAAGAPAAAGSATNSGEIQDRQELLGLQQELKEQSRQMAEDEETMMAQLRQMEMSLARDRAELARQRADLQRLHGELKHELDIASRDGGLRERLGALQRGVANAAHPSRNAGKPDGVSGQPAKSANGQEGNPITKSGLFRRIFGARE